MMQSSERELLKEMLRLLEEHTNDTAIMQGVAANRILRLVLQLLIEKAQS